MYIPKSETSTVTVRGFAKKDNGQLVLTVHLQGDPIAEQCHDGEHNMRFGLMGSSYNDPRFQKELRDIAMLKKFPADMFDLFVEVTDYRFALAQVRASIRSTKVEIGNCEKKIEHYEPRLPKLEADLGDLKVKLAGLETEVTLQEESEQLTSLKAQLADQREKYQKLTKENDEKKSLRREMSVANERIRELSNPRSNLRADISDIEEKISKATKEIKTANKDISRLQAKLALLVTDEADLSKKISHRLNS